MTRYMLESSHGNQPLRSELKLNELSTTQLGKQGGKTDAVDKKLGSRVAEPKSRYRMRTAYSLTAQEP